MLTLNTLLGAMIWVISLMQAELAYFVLKLANFRSHGNRGLSEPNFPYTILLPDPDNPTLEPKITTLSYTEPKFWHFKISPLWE